MRTVEQKLRTSLQRADADLRYLTITAIHLVTCIMDAFDPEGPTQAALIYPEMALVRPRLNDYYGLSFTQEEADFAIPFLDDDIPLYVDPFLLWKSPSQQDQALHTALISSFNHFGHLAKVGKRKEAVEALIRVSECQEGRFGFRA